MNELCFATTNDGKVASLRRAFEKAGTNANVRQLKLALIEPQADTSREVALVKARQAYEQTGKAVLVDDSSFHIVALNGFPGPYAKYMNETIGPDGYIKVMHGIDDRRAYFMNNLVFIDDDGTEYVFEGSPYPGVITKEVSTVADPTAWSELFRIFMPEGSNKVLAEMTPEERREKETRNLQKDCYLDFARWLKQQAK